MELQTPAQREEFCSTQQKYIRLYSFIPHMITTLNGTYDLNLTEEDKVDMQRIRTKLEADERLQAVLNADNPWDAKVYKFNQVLDRLLL